MLNIYVQLDWYKCNYREKSKKTDTENFGSGILVLNTNEKSIIENTIFDKLSAPKISSGKGLLGAINFYKADVVLNNVTFLDNLYGDDYLNIINSNFELKNSLFENTVADAIDIDFGNGIIENLEINNIRNIIKIFKCASNNGFYQVPLKIISISTSDYLLMKDKSFTSYGSLQRKIVIWSFM